MSLIRVVVAGDHPLIREGLSAVLQRNNSASVVARVCTWQALVFAAEKTHPDLVLMDVERTRLGWIRAVEEIRKISSQVVLVCLSSNGDPEFLEEMRLAGALTKTITEAGNEDILEFVGRLAGRSEPPVRSHPVPPKKTGQPLTAREREILRRVARGSMSQQIATELNLSVRTVEFHRANLLRKTGLRSVADLTRFAIRNGVLPANLLLDELT